MLIGTELELAVGDMVFVKALRLRHTMRFSSSGELAPRDVDPFHIIERIGKLDIE